MDRQCIFAFKLKDLWEMAVKASLSLDVFLSEKICEPGILYIVMEKMISLDLILWTGKQSFFN